MSEYYVTKGYKDDVYLGHDWNKSYSMELDNLKDFVLNNNLMIEQLDEDSLSIAYTDGNVEVVARAEDYQDYDTLKEWSEESLAEFTSNIVPMR